MSRPLETFGIENPDLNMKDAMDQLEEEEKDMVFEFDGHNPMQKLYEGKLLVNLEGNFKRNWDYLQLMIIFYISATAPFKIAFVEDY